MLQAGDKAPLDIQLDTESQPRKLRDLLGTYTVLYFYPKDNTPGCTVQACSLRDYKEEITKAGAQIIGVSKDGIKSHKNFREKHNLNFELWSDTDTELMKAFGTLVEKSMFGKRYLGTKRSTFLISPEGTIIKVWPDADPKDHGLEILTALKQETAT